MIVKRKPTMNESLKVLLDYGVKVGSVLDVGILTGTQPLIEVFKNVQHHLFEPVNLHFNQIEKNYRNIDFKLHNVALSDSDGKSYLSCRSIHRDGKVTHADVVDQPVTAEDVEGFVSCIEIPKSKLDTIVANEAPEQPYLLKIDVDGHEMNVLAGAQETLKASSIVVIEAPINRVMTPQFFERSQYLFEQGFFLMDIVDLAYYGGVLWQVDLVFVRRDLVADIDELRPFQAESFNFSGDQWYPLSDRLFR